MLLEVHNMDIQLCCFLARIYVCVHLFGCHNKSMSFQKLNSSNVFYARARQMMPVAFDGPLQELYRCEAASYI